MIDHNTTPDWNTIGLCIGINTIAVAVGIPIVKFILKMLTVSPKQRFGTQEKENGNE